jgi:GDP-mannose 6-dehydrogenase
MKVALFGLGYVGCVSAACFARSGIGVVGVDVNPTKVNLLHGGSSPIVEKDVGPFLQEAAASGRLRATTEARDAVLDTDLAIVCVGTPSQRGGGLDLSHVFGVAAQIGTALRDRAEPYVIVVRSTRQAPIASPRSWRRSPANNGGCDFAVVANPEFARRHRGRRLPHPPFTVWAAGTTGRWIGRGFVSRPKHRSCACAAVTPKW